MMANFDWTEERVARLRELHAEGLPFSQIGTELGCTRNAAIGKAARIGLAKPGDDTKGWRKGLVAKEPRAARPRVKRRRPWKPLPADEDLHPGTPELIELADTPSNPVIFSDLQSHHCRWPIGDPQSPDFVFCGADKVEGNSYCGRHCAVAFSHHGNLGRERPDFARVIAKYRTRGRAKPISRTFIDEDAA